MTGRIFDIRLRSAQVELIAAIRDTDMQSFFDPPQVLVELPAQIGQTFVIQRLKSQVHCRSLFFQDFAHLKRGERPLQFGHAKNSVTLR